jgi:inhibitor of cysteine peptidase
VITLTIGDNGKTIEVKAGDTLVIRLDENPTTGYRWAVERGGEGFFDPPSAEFIRDPDAKTGAGGSRIFTFHALKPGKTSLALKYWRAWQGESSVSSRFDVDVLVTGG